MACLRELAAHSPYYMFPLHQYLSVYLVVSHQGVLDGILVWDIEWPSLAN